MSRPIGREVIEHWAYPPKQFGSKGEAYLVKTYRGCWPSFSATDEGVGENHQVLTTVLSWYIPATVETVSSEDFFVWKRFPDNKYYVEGDISRLIDRRGRARASIVPVETRS